MTLSLVPCSHYWLAVKYDANSVIALCNRKACAPGSPTTFTLAEWQEMKAEGCALDKVTYL